MVYHEAWIGGLFACSFYQTGYFFASAAQRVWRLSSLSDALVGHLHRVFARVLFPLYKALCKAGLIQA